MTFNNELHVYTELEKGFLKKGNLQFIGLGVFLIVFCFLFWIYAEDLIRVRSLFFSKVPKIYISILGSLIGVSTIFLYTLAFSSVKTIRLKEDKILFISVRNEKFKYDVREIEFITAKLLGRLSGCFIILTKDKKKHKISFVIQNLDFFLQEMEKRSVYIEDKSKILKQYKHGFIYANKPHMKREEGEAFKRRF